MTHRHSPAAVDATRAGLRYADPGDPGIRREGPPGRVRYRRPNGSLVRDAPTLARIRAAAIPPAWTDIWISPDPSGHLQAVGRDARGRRQYRYHREFRASRDAAKFDRVIRFAERLPRIRRRVGRDLRAPGLPREKVLAAMVRLLELTFLRVGSDEYARLNRSFGLSTLRNRHVQVRGDRVRFRFRGKSGKDHEVGLTDRRLAGLVRRCQELPGQHLFEYVDSEGEPQRVDSDAVNDYIRAAAGDDTVSAKDFRTWAGTVLAHRSLQAAPRVETGADARRNVVAAVEATAEQLGNTPAVARASYVHPEVVDSYLLTGTNSAGRGNPDGRRQPGRRRPPAGPPSPAEERAVLALLRSHRRSR